MTCGRSYSELIPDLDLEPRSSQIYPEAILLLSEITFEDMLIISTFTYYSLDIINSTLHLLTHTFLLTTQQNRYNFLFVLFCLTTIEWLQPTEFSL